MNWIRETLRCTLCCRFLLSCRPDFQSVKCLLKLKPNSVSWDWEPGTAVFDALFSEEEISCKQWLLALQLQQYITACRQKKRTFYATCKCTIRIQYPFKKIRIQWHSDTVWILFSLNLRQIVWLYFFHMVPELDEEAFRNRKEDLDQDSL